MLSSVTLMEECETGNTHSDMKRGERQFSAPITVSIISKKDAEGPYCTPNSNSQEDKALSRLKSPSCNIVVWFALSIALKFVDGKIKQMLFTWVLAFTWTQNDLRDMNFHSGLKLGWFMDQQQLWVSICTTQTRGLRNQDLPVAEISWGLPSQHAIRDSSPLQARLTQTGQEGAISHWEFFNKGLPCTF